MSTAMIYQVISGENFENISEWSDDDHKINEAIKGLLKEVQGLSDYECRVYEAYALLASGKKSDIEMSIESLSNIIAGLYAVRNTYANHTIRV